MRSTYRMMNHFVSPRGRICRSHFWISCLLAWGMFWVAVALCDGLTDWDLTRIPALLLAWSLFCLCTKRAHDLDHSAARLALLLLPLLGPIWLVGELGLRRGSVGENSFGIDPRDVNRRERDYARVT